MSVCVCVWVSGSCLRRRNNTETKQTKNKYNERWMCVDVDDLSPVTLTISLWQNIYYYFSHLSARGTRKLTVTGRFQREEWTGQKATKSRYVLYSICICTQSATKSNWFSFFFPLVRSLTMRDERMKKKTGQFNVKKNTTQFDGLTHVRVFRIGLNRMETMTTAMAMMTKKTMGLTMMVDMHTRSRWCWMSHLRRGRGGGVGEFY